MARFAKGTSLWKGTSGSPGSMQKIAEPKSFSGPNVQVTTQDTTTHDTEDNFREITATLLTGGPIQFEVNYNPDDPTHAALWNDMLNLTKGYYELRFNPASNPLNNKIAFNGFVTNHPLNFPVDGVQTANIQITTTGRLTLSADA